MGLSEATDAGAVTAAGQSAANVAAAIHWWAKETLPLVQSSKSQLFRQGEAAAEFPPPGEEAVAQIDGSNGRSQSNQVVTRP
jgi:hypothetical protein